MPKIDLKPNSPEYTDGKDTSRSSKRRVCDMPGCAESGEHRAPKDKNLSDYYHFCFEHAQEYNKAWNYFSDMSMHEMEDYINKSTVWDRPTQRYDTMANYEKLKRKAWQTYHFTEAEPPKGENGRGHGNINRNSQEFDALIIMGLEPPLDLDKIKARYKELAKKYHPDLNRKDPNAEELLKKINMAYTVLKVAFQKYESLEQKA